MPKDTFFLLVLQQTNCSEKLGIANRETPPDIKLEGGKEGEGKEKFVCRSCKAMTVSISCLLSNDN